VSNQEIGAEVLGTVIISLLSTKSRCKNNWVGEDFEQHLLMNLDYAARIYPQLWRGLETDQPVGIFLVTGEN
jgi:hypothetical protein